MKGRTRPFELKALDDSGSFTGYAAKFGNIDGGGDLIMSGAFAEHLSSVDIKRIPVLWQHNSHEPIGITTSMVEDDHGLLVTGSLEMTVQKAREVNALAKIGAIGGLSIGYFAKDWAWENGVRILKKLGLFEYSMVTFPMNDQAVILDVKSADLKSLADCESYLRDACDMTRSEAKTFISRVLGAARVDACDLTTESERISKALQNINQSFKRGS